MGTPAGATGNAQTREVFAAEAAAIAERHRRLTWLAPSRDESGVGPVLISEAPEIWTASDTAQSDGDALPPSIQGGRERGLVLHKLFEEVLTGETSDEPAALEDRARALIIAIGKPVADDPSQGLSPGELAGCVARTLALPQIVRLRPTLAPEFPAYAATVVGEVEQATAGIADAISFGSDGKPVMVIDWKSDVQPTAGIIEHYRAQVRAYLDMTGAERGLIVLVTSGEILAVAPSPVPAVAA
jgi:hypothetical protein